MPNGAWLLLGIGCALVLGTLLVVFIIPSDRRRRPVRFTPPTLERAAASRFLPARQRARCSRDSAICTRR